MFDEKKEVRLIFDQAIAQSETLLALHPMNNASTIFISPQDVLKFTKEMGRTCEIVSFEENRIDGSKQFASNKGLKKINPDEKGLSTTREDNFARWYTEVVTKAEMIDYYEVSGCYILRPNSCFIWNKIREFFNGEMTRFGVEEAYFPMFVTRKALESEASHIKGFKPEVAWVTRNGDHELSVPLAIRPTSETIIYPAFRNWVRSHRDLPIKLNQWSNVVRWEFSNPTPFIRTREFLWQEGHSVFSTKEEADEEVIDILEVYSNIYERLLAVPVIKGRKTDLEKFPGADYTTTVEAFIPSTGRSIQGGTSHGLGQNFGKIFGLEFEDETEAKRVPFQNSWGFTTRSIGVMIMTHGDDRGLVIPPRVARHQIVVVPIFVKFNEEDKARFRQYYMDIVNTLKLHKIRAIVDERQNYKPGWKYNHWELQGVPLRVEFGPKDMLRKQCIFVRRDTGEKISVELHEVHKKAEEILAKIQTALFERAKANVDAKRATVLNWTDFERALVEKCFSEAPFCGTTECEQDIKVRTKGDEKMNETATAAGKENGIPLSGSAKSLCAQPAFTL